MGRVMLTRTEWGNGDGMEKGVERGMELELEMGMGMGMEMAIDSVHTVCPV